MKTAKGRVHFQDIGPGFWSVVTPSGDNLRPVLMPEELKREGLEIQITYQSVFEEVSIFMWGEPIEIMHYEVLDNRK